MRKGEQIEALYASSFRGPFPYDDCLWLADCIGKPSSDLIPELDWYFSSIAGYSSSASRLANRTPEELRAAERFLTKDFFLYFPDLNCYRHLIDKENTPRLYQRLIIAEQMRQGLLVLLSEAGGPGPKN